jgi:hypothetical protein
MLQSLHANLAMNAMGYAAQALMWQLKHQQL